MSLINISLCLTDLPKDKMKVGKNGKKYINLCVSELREEGKFGDTHTVFVSQTKEERGANVPVTFVGSGKAFAPQVVNAQAVENMPVAGNTDDLPF
jgi:hypothetical protein